MVKPDQIGEIYVISRMLKLFGHYVWAQAEHSKRLDQLQRKLLTQSWFLYTENNKINLNLWSVDILNISVEQVSQPDDIIQVGCLLGFGKHIVHILK